MSLTLNGDNKITFVVKTKYITEYSLESQTLPHNIELIVVTHLQYLFVVRVKFQAYFRV